MNINQFIFVGIIILEFLIYRLLFSKKNVEKWIKITQDKSEYYDNNKDFIEMKKFQFERNERTSELLLGFILIMLIGAKITNILSLIGTAMLSIIFVSGVVSYAILNKIHNQTIERLYSAINGKR